jgi:MraZ protein
MELQRRSEKAPVLTNLGDHLALYPADVWEKKEESLLELSDMQPDVQDYQRYMVADATDAPLDAQGRILVPAPLRKEAALESKVLIAGVLDKIEIWNPERFEERKRMTLHRLDDIQKSVDRHRNPRGA